MPHMHLVPQLGVTPFVFHQDLRYHKTRVPGLSNRVVFMSLCLAILTDGQMDGETHDDSTYRASIASCSTNLSSKAYCYTTLQCKIMAKYKWVVEWLVYRPQTAPIGKQQQRHLRCCHCKLQFTVHRLRPVATATWCKEQVRSHHHRDALCRHLVRWLFCNFIKKIKKHLCHRTM